LSATNGRRPLELLVITALPGLVYFDHHNARSLKEQADPWLAKDQITIIFCADARFCAKFVRNLGFTHIFVGQCRSQFLPK
jgi:hypothetical protein